MPIILLIILAFNIM